MGTSNPWKAEVNEFLIHMFNKLILYHHYTLGYGCELSLLIELLTTLNNMLGIICMTAK